MTQFRIDQVRPSGTSVGTTGEARKSLWLSRRLNFVSTGTGLSPSWTLLDAPSGSSAVIADSSSSTAWLVPDAYGTYRIRLSDSLGISTLVATVDCDSSGAAAASYRQFLPGVGEVAGERNYSHNTRGWAERIEKLIDSLDGSVGPTGPTGPTGAFSFLPPQNTTTDAHLVAFWRFDGDLTDSSGNGHTLTTQTGTPIYVVEQTGSCRKSVYCYNWSGLAAYNEALVLTGDLTLECVVRCCMVNETTFRVISCIGDYGVYELHVINTPSAGIYFKYVHQAGGVDVSSATAGVFLPLGVPVHLAAVRDSVNKVVSLYCNGALVHSASYEYQTISGGTSRVCVGSYNGSTNGSYLISYQAVAIYNAVRSAPQILADAQACLPWLASLA